MSKSRKAMVLGSGLMLSALVMAGGSPVAAQSTATVCGAVTDQYGGVIPGVAVSLGRNTSAEKAAVTAKDGEFVFAGVEPGTYTVTFALDGFKKAVRNGIAIAGGQEFRADQRMEPAGPVSHPDPSRASVAYDQVRTQTGTTFTKTSTAAATIAPRPCKREK